MCQTLMTPFVTLLAVVAFPERASVIPIIYGSGDTISYIADLPANSPARMPGTFMVGGNPSRLGYKHYRFHIFWIPLWTSTSEGEFVAYNEIGLWSTPYIPLGTDPGEVSTKTGIPRSQLEIPWSARNSWGFYLLIVVFILGIVAAWFLSRWEKHQTGPWPGKMDSQSPRVDKLSLGANGKNGVWFRKRAPWED